MICGTARAYDTEVRGVVRCSLAGVGIFLFGLCQFSILAVAAVPDFTNIFLLLFLSSWPDNSLRYHSAQSALRIVIMPSMTHPAAIVG